MDRDLIVRVLKSSCSNENLRYQVVVHNSKLHIYLNRKANYAPNYELLTQKISKAIASLNFDDLEGIWLYSRSLGEVEPDWQIFVEFPIEVDKAEDIGDTFNQSEETTAETTSNLGEVTENDSLGDTGLLKQTGLIHGKALKQEDIQTFIKDNLEELNDELIVQTNSLVQYCFVNNKKILTGDIIFPNKETVRLVKFFHHLSDSNKQKILPILETYFQSGETPNTEGIAIALQKWLKEITELNTENRREIAIWLSRYCFNSSGTMTEFQAWAQKAEKAEATKKNKRSNTEYSFTPAKTPIVTIARDRQSEELITPKFKLPSGIKKFLVPIVWTFFTVILICLGVYTSQTEKSSFKQTPSLCQTSIGSPEYCRLAVNLAGEAAIERASENIFPISEVTQSVADYGCQRYANVKAEAWKNLDPKNNPVLSSSGEKIFPHIYVVEAVQKKAKAGGKVRVGCVYTTGVGERSPSKLANDIIPNDWPTQSYQQGQTRSNLAFGIYTNPINLALYTMFGAVGIAIVSKFDLGIQAIERPKTIYSIALILGIVQLIAVSLPGFNLIASIVLPILAILAIEPVNKSFNINWNYSYALIGAGIGAIVAIQFLLYGISIKLIQSLV